MLFEADSKDKNGENMLIKSTPTLRSSRASREVLINLASRLCSKTKFTTLLTALLAICALILPLNLYADYSKSCSACHGEKGEGGFGPALVGVKFDKDEFKKTVRGGKGMMPAISEDELNNEELDGIYAELSRSSGSAEAGIGILSVTKNVRAIAWGSILIMLAGAIYIVAVKYIKWSALVSAKKYYSALGALACLKIAYRVFFIDTLSVSSVYNKDRKRWFVHGLIAYGFIGLIIADIMISIFNPARAALPLFSPLKIFVNLSGLALLIGLAIVVYRLFTDPYENNGVTLAGDILFVAFLIVVTLSGFATEAVRYLKFPQYVQYTYFVHILFIVFLIISAPFTRFVHILSTFFFVLNTKLAQAVIASGIVLGFNEEPSPGRHFKSEKIAKDMFGAETKIRYFP